MTDAFEIISQLWSQFPTEFKNSKLFEDVNKLKSTFEEKNDFFDKFLTKIVIIGSVSTGKSTLINTLLSTEYFGTLEGNGTVAFFYCSLSEKDYEYFTVNNGPIEFREIETLRNASRLNDNLPDYFDENSVLKVYIKHDESRLLKRKTVIMDCPGFGYNTNYDEEIKNHCSNADLFIIMFEIDKPPTVNQIKYIQTIRENHKNPTCFFVYNKCDSSKFNEQMKTTLSTTFFDLSTARLRLNCSPLYFISAKNPNMFEDFARLKRDIMDHKDISYLRYSNIMSILSSEINIYRELLNQFVSNEKEKISTLKIINEMRNRIINYIEKRIEICKSNLLLEKILEIILTEIYDYDRKCNKENASIMICKVEENIKRKVEDFIEKRLIDSCIDPINRKIKEFINDNTNGTIIFKDIDFRISRNHFIIPAYRNIKNIFWWFEFGDKTMKVKDSFATFIQSEAIKKQIKDSMINIYENELSEIRICYEDFLEKSSWESINFSEIKLEILVNYQEEVYENNRKFDSISERIINN